MPHFCGFSVSDSSSQRAFYSLQLFSFLWSYNSNHSFPCQGFSRHSSPARLPRSSWLKPSKSLCWITPCDSIRKSAFRMVLLRRSITTPGHFLSSKSRFSNAQNFSDGDFSESRISRRIPHCKFQFILILNMPIRHSRHPHFKDSLTLVLQFLFYPKERVKSTMCCNQFLCLQAPGLSSRNHDKGSCF